MCRDTHGPAASGGSGPVPTLGSPPPRAGQRAPGGRLPWPAFGRGVSSLPRTYGAVRPGSMSGCADARGRAVLVVRRICPHHDGDKRLLRFFRFLEEVTALPEGLLWFSWMASRRAGFLGSGPPGSWRSRGPDQSRWPAAGVPGSGCASSPPTPPEAAPITFRAPDRLAPQQRLLLPGGIAVHGRGRFSTLFLMC